MKNHKFLKIIVLALIFFGAGCNEEAFLDVSNPNEIDGNNFFNNVNDLSLVLTSVYAAQTGYEMWGSEFLAKNLYGPAHIADQDWLGTASWNDLYRNEQDADNGDVTRAWRSLYRGVARANDLIQNAQRFLEERNPSPADVEAVNLMLGQAYFLRAFDYFHLVRTFGVEQYYENPQALAVPIILEIPTTREEMFVSRNTVGEVYDQIIADLKEAERLLPESWDDRNRARVTRWAAKGYLGKVYLYQQNWTEARRYFEDIINNGPFSLLSFEEYDNMFRGGTEFSTESLFELNFAQDLEENKWQGGLGSNTALIIAPKGAGWSNVYPHDVNIRRFGNDPRLHVCALEPGVDSIVLSGEWRTLEVFVPDDGALGWSFKKYVPIDFSVYQTNRNYGANIILMRLADVYLMYAEVLNALGEDEMALAYTNKTKRRAHRQDPNVPSLEFDYPAGLTGTALRDTIREERFRELFAEGHRWYDIVRWGIAAEEVAKYPRVRSGVIQFDPWDVYMPIPNREIEANPNMVQSPGY